MKRLLWAIVALSTLGFGLAVYSAAHKTGFVSGALCDLSETFSCDIVNRGPFSDVLGVPVAFIGLIGYAFFALTALLKLRQQEDKTLTWFLFFQTFFGLLFTLYLTGIEAFVLRAWCVVCLGSQAVMLALFACAARVLWLEERTPWQKARAFVGGLFRRRPTSPL